MNLRLVSAEVSANAYYTLKEAVEVTRSSGETFSTNTLKVRFDSDGEAFVTAYEPGEGLKTISPACAIEILDALGLPAENRRNRHVYLRNSLRLF